MYRLRSISSGVCLPQPRTNSMKNSFMYDGAKLWNSIPNSGVASGPAVPPGGTKNFQKYEKMFYTETKITVLSILKI